MTGDGGFVAAAPVSTKQRCCRAAVTAAAATAGAATTPGEWTWTARFRVRQQRVAILVRITLVKIDRFQLKLARFMVHSVYDQISSFVRVFVQTAGTLKAQVASWTRWHKQLQPDAFVCRLLDTKAPCSLCREDSCCSCAVKPKFHYADFPETSPPGDVLGKSA